MTGDDKGDNPGDYGSKGQAWSPEFVAYMRWIVGHPNYQGMPDAVKRDGKIQWEAPSNRGPGEYQETNQRRREWWRNKAAELDIPTIGHWLSATARRVHPTGKKPCKRCGQVLRLAYAYPSQLMRARAAEIYGEPQAPQQLEEVGDFVRRLHANAGAAALLKLPQLFRAKGIDPPNLGENLLGWVNWIETELIPRNPRGLLSPGAMSNAPDRLDGFHSFNACCRSEADTGRHDANLKTYLTDRRVFEYWSDGDWIAADRLMGLVRTDLAGAECADGGDGAPSPDHIGPLSLGFCHRPEFRLLSRSANSAKNNRMSLSDVRLLVERERSGVMIVSWYAHRVWSLLKDRVDSEEKALRLSKIMRDNQRAALGLLRQLLERGHAAFLASLLELEHANFDVHFANLRSEEFLTRFDQISRTARTTKYASEQKARRLRVGFAALGLSAEKENRHQGFSSEIIERLMERIDDTLAQAPEETLVLNQRILQALTEGDEEKLRELCELIPKLREVPAFMATRRELESAMRSVAAALAAEWNADRYVRDTGEDE